VRARIERDLARVVQEVRAADPALRAVVLTGGFARGEGALLQGKPLNDYDLLALRGAARPVAYEPLRARLETALRAHVDLQPVWATRLRWASPTVFWYETALRGRTLWGDPALLGRIPVRDPARLDRREGLRMLSNRAAGLLLVEGQPDALALRVQASKGLLAALDAHLLAQRRFAPSQRERWTLVEDDLAAGGAPSTLAEHAPWLRWAMAFKLDPTGAKDAHPAEAWRAAAEAIAAAVPRALAAAGLGSLEAFARADGAAENLAYRVRAREAGAKPWAPHPTGRVRAAALALLLERVGAREHGTGRRYLAPLLEAPAADDVRALAQLRRIAHA
jgi:predicted nucleotidyltransferase